jgi:hypothetical protein
MDAIPLGLGKACSCLVLHQLGGGGQPKVALRSPERNHWVLLQSSSCSACAFLVITVGQPIRAHDCKTRVVRQERTAPSAPISAFPRPVKSRPPLLHRGSLSAFQRFSFSAFQLFRILPCRPPVQLFSASALQHFLHGSPGCSWLAPWLFSRPAAPPGKGPFASS